MKKRMLVLVLALVMVLSLLPFGASAAEIVDSGKCGKNVTWTLDSNGLLTIKGKGAMDDYSTADDADNISPFKAYKNQIKTVDIKQGVTSIGETAFVFCSSLKSVTIPESVTSIGHFAFSGCTGLTSVTIPEGVTSIGYGAFEYCASLTSITIPDSVTSIGGWAFRCCSTLMSVTIPEGVTSIEDSLFLGCTELTSITIPLSVTSIGESAFSQCSALKSLTIPVGVTSIEAFTFSGCSSLESVFIPASVETIGYNAFGGCDSLSKVFYGGAQNRLMRITGEENQQLIYADYIHYNAEDINDHDWNSGEVTKAATETAEGEMTYTCTICGETKTEAIPKLEPISNPFKDVKKDAYYFDSVLWAVNHDPVVTAGTSATTFSPNNDCTRAQMVTFLWRAAGEPKPASTKNPFKDVKKGAYYYDAVLWAVGEGITAGTSQNTFSPDDTVIRGQTVTFLWRMADQPTVKAKNPFKDVKSSAYYYDAVLWAVKNNITAGTSANAFSPNDSCTRAQIVTFLYRDLG